MKKVYAVFVFFLISTLYGTTASRAQTDNRLPYWMPATSTRAKICRVKESDIDFIEIFGEDMLPRESKESIIVDDKALIHKFVTALQLAVRMHKPASSPGEEVGNMAHDEAAAPTLSDGILRLHMKGQKAPLHDLYSTDEFSDLVFLFRSSSSQSCFGDKFQRCLRELGTYQAEKIRQRVTKIAPNVVAFRIGDYDEVLFLAPRLSEPATVKTLMTALSQSDECLFVGVNKKTGDKATTQTLILLELKDGSTAELDLMLAPLSRNPDQTPEWLKNLYILLEKSRPEPNL